MRSTGRRRLAPAVVAAVVALGGCTVDPDAGTAARSQPATTAPPAADGAEDTGASGGFDPDEDDVAQLEALVEARADAVVAGDEAAFLATVDPDRPKLLEQQRVLFANLVELGSGLAGLPARPLDVPRPGAGARRRPRRPPRRASST